MAVKMEVNVESSVPMQEFFVYTTGPVDAFVLQAGPRGGRLLSSGTRPPPPPPPCPPGPLSYQGSIAAGHTYGGAEGAQKIFPLPT